MTSSATHNNVLEGQMTPRNANDLHSICAKVDCTRPVHPMTARWVQCLKCQQQWHLNCLPVPNGVAPHFKSRSRKGTINICPNCDPLEFETRALNRYHRTLSFSMDSIWTTSLLDDWPHESSIDNDKDILLAMDGYYCGDSPASIMTQCISGRSARSHSVGSLTGLYSELGSEALEPSKSSSDLTPEGEADVGEQRPAVRSTAFSLSTGSTDDDNVLFEAEVNNGIPQIVNINGCTAKAAAVSTLAFKPSMPPRRTQSLRRVSVSISTQTEDGLSNSNRIIGPPPFPHPLSRSDRSFSVCGTLATFFGSRRPESLRKITALSESLDERSLSSARKDSDSDSKTMNKWNSRKYSLWVWEKWDSTINLLRQRGWVCVYVSKAVRKFRSGHGRPCFKIEGSLRGMTEEKERELDACWTKDIRLIRAYFVDYPMRMERDISEILRTSYEWEYKWFSCFREIDSCGIGHKNEWMGMKAHIQPVPTATEMVQHLDEVCRGWLKQYNCDMTKTIKSPLPSNYDLYI